MLPWLEAPARQIPKWKAKKKGKSLDSGKCEDALGGVAELWDTFSARELLPVCIPSHVK